MKHATGNIIEVTVDGTLKSEDFKEMGAEADALIKEHGSARVLINASHFNGWEDVGAAEKHFIFVKEHHHKIERLAVISGHAWQHWLGAMVQVFVHPKVKVFDKEQIEEARAWIKTTEQL